MSGTSGGADFYGLRATSHRVVAAVNQPGAVLQSAAISNDWILPVQLS